jgi:cold shock CspA family protein
LQTVVKKWFRDKAAGILENGDGPEIAVRKADLVGCQFLKAGARVEFECYAEKTGLIAKKVKLVNGQNRKNKNRKAKEFRFGVMT